MRIPAIFRQTYEDYADAPEWFRRFLDYENNANDAFVTAFRNGLTIGDNDRAQVVLLEFTHGIALTFPYAQKTQIEELRVTQPNGGAAIANHAWILNQSREIVLTINFVAAGTTKSMVKVIIQAQ